VLAVALVRRLVVVGNPAGVGECRLTHPLLRPTAAVFVLADVSPWNFTLASRLEWGPEGFGTPRCLTVSPFDSPAPLPFGQNRSTDWPRWLRGGL
jgi:hypothetical protein